MSKLARWGSIVDGIDVGGGWVQVNDHFLPKEIDGVPVLFPQGESCCTDGSAPQPLVQRRPAGRREEPKLGTVPETQEGPEPSRPPAAVAHGSRQRRSSHGGFRRNRQAEEAAAPVL